jgi:hypothetical protein
MKTLKYLLITALLGTNGFALAKPSSAAAHNDKNGATEVHMYRYVNKQGTKVTSNQIPPEYVKKGYQIVSGNGTVIEEVAPELSEAEKKLLTQDQLSKAEQKEKDKQLMLRYGQLSDLLQARDRKIPELENKIKAEEANLSAIHGQITSEQEKAAQQERSGKKVPDFILTKLKGLYHDQEISEDHINTYKETLAIESKQFESDISRYEFISNLRTKKQLSAPKTPTETKP